jgi:hypothetical protein
MDKVPLIAACAALALCAWAAATARAQSAVQTRWQAYADCAAGYRANWQDRRTDPSRSKQMADMILMQSEDYQMGAVRHLKQETAAGEAEAQRTVQSYIDANLGRFIAMDEADELNAFLDRCPQPDENGRL